MLIELSIYVRFKKQHVQRLIISMIFNNKQQLLLRAVANGEHVKVERLLERRWFRRAVNPNIAGYGGTTVLMDATTNHYFYIARLLIKNGADVNARDNNEKTALITVAGYGNMRAAELLIKNGADVNAKDYLGWTALMHAAKYCHIGAVELLLENGADVNANDNDGWTALMYTMSSGFIPSDTPIDLMIKMLLEKGADPYRRNYYGEDAYEIAIKSKLTRKLVDMLPQGVAKKTVEESRGALARLKRGINATNKVI